MKRKRVTTMLFAAAIAFFLMSGVALPASSWTSPATGTIYVDPAGTLVGIGTVGPVGQLEVIGNINWADGWRTGIVSSSADFPTFRLRAYASGKTSFIGNDMDGGLYFGVNCSDSAIGSYAMTLAPIGNVGIGTTTPEAKLDVQTTTSNLWINMGSATQTSYTDLELESNTGNAQIWKAGSGYAGYGGASALNIYNSENTPIAFYQGTNERLRINSGGNIGIGTTSPFTPLEISSDGTSSLSD